MENIPSRLYQGTTVASREVGELLNTLVRQRYLSAYEDIWTDFDKWESNFPDYLSIPGHKAFTILRSREGLSDLAALDSGH